MFLAKIFALWSMGIQLVPSPLKKVRSAVHRRIWKHVKQITVANFVFSMHQSFIVMLYSVCNYFWLCMISQSYTFVRHCLSDALTKAAIFEKCDIYDIYFFFQPGSLVNVQKDYIIWITSSFKLFVCWGLTSQSTIFQSCRDGATASWVINQYFRGVKCLAHVSNPNHVSRYRTPDLSLRSPTLYHWATALPSFKLSIPISKVLIKPAIAWQWLYVVYPHFAPRDQTF